MKRVKRIVLFLAFLASIFALLFSGCSSVKSSGVGGADMDSEQRNAALEALPKTKLPEKDQSELWNNLNLTPTEIEKFSSPLFSFDVSSDGSLALVTNDNQLILLHNTEDGQTISGYTFHTTGIVGVAWHGENVCLYLLRGETIVEITQEGKLIQASELKRQDADTIERVDNVFFQREAKDN